MGDGGNSVHSTARNTMCLLVAVTHPKNSYSPRTPCSSLLPLLNAHTAASGKQRNFTRKPASHNKSSEGKAASPKVASNLPSTTDGSHQAMPASKQVSGSRPVAVRCPQASCRPWCLVPGKKPPAYRGRKQQLLLQSSPGHTQAPPVASSTAWPEMICLAGLRELPRAGYPHFTGAFLCAGWGLPRLLTALAKSTQVSSSHAPSAAIPRSSSPAHVWKELAEMWEHDSVPGH